MTATRTFVNRAVPNTKYLNPEDIPKAIETLLPPDKVEELARKARFVERERKIHPYEFLITLVLGFGIRLQRTLSNLRNNYYDLTKIDFSESAWHDRFNKNLIHSSNIAWILIQLNPVGNRQEKL